MSPRLSMIVVLGFVLAAPIAMGDSESASAWAPTKVVAIASPSASIVTWVPGAVMADSYIVYGLRDGAPVPIQYVEVAETTAEVEGGFAQYGVVGVFNGVPSPMRVATTVGPPCIVIVTYSPPSVTLCSWLPARGELMFDGMDARVV